MKAFNLFSELLDKLFGSSAQPQPVPVRVKNHP